MENNIEKFLLDEIEWKMIEQWAADRAAELAHEVSEYDNSSDELKQELLRAQGILLKVQIILRAIKEENKSYEIYGAVINEI